jgi:thiamine biosynthesis protein ThiI
MKKIISLLSTGFDSPVATYLMIKKEFNPIFLSFLTSEDKYTTMRTKIIKIIQKLSNFTPFKLKSYLINHDPNLEIFKEMCERKLTCVLCKRLMIRIAIEICQLESTNIIVTGDILGEQASQTLNNLYSYNNLLKNFVIIRPLIGLNKLDVLEINKRIGLYEIVSEKSASCQYYPQYPETNAKSIEVNNEESKIRFERIVENSLGSAEVLSL